MKAPRLLALACILGIAHALTFLGSGPLDDDFIIYRYARNLVQSNGLVFNAGERVEGYTAPLWVLLLAPAIALGADPRAASVAFCIAGLVAAILAVGRYWQFRWRTAWPVPALLLAASPAAAMHSIAGLGTMLLAGLLAVWFWLFARAEEGKSGFLLPACPLALACLLRAEAVLFVLPFGWACWSLRRQWRPAAVAALPALGWLAFRLWYYGRWLPVSYHVKKLPLLEDLRYGLAYFWTSSLECGVGVFLALAVAYVVRRPVAASEKAAVTGLLLHTAYVVYVGGDYFRLARFFLPTLPLMIALGCRGASTFLPSRRLALGALSAALIATQWPQIRRPELFALHAENEERWIAIGRHLRTALPRDASIAVSAVGAIGFHSGLRIVDILGITNEHTMHRPPDLRIEIKGHHRYDAEWALSEAPLMIIIGTGKMDVTTNTLVFYAWEESLYAHPRFETDYVPVIMPIPGSYPLIAYLRRSAPLPPGARQVERR